MHDGRVAGEARGGAVGTNSMSHVTSYTNDDVAADGASGGGPPRDPGDEVSSS